MIGARFLSELRRRKHSQIFAIPPIATGLVIALHLTGLLQGLDLFFLDYFVRWRPPKPQDSRVTIVTIDDDDITRINHWPISDQRLAEALEVLIALQPQTIALALYRDLPVEPGHDRLTHVFRSTPNLIGIEKRFGEKQILPPPTLAAVNQVALADVVIDQDGVIRRALLFATDEMGNSYSSISAQAALQYLEALDIKPQTVNDATGKIKLGRAIFHPLRAYEGAYVRVDDRGYQILINYQGSKDRFQTVSLTDVLEGRVPPAMVRDRIVFIGSIAESTKDYFQTPYNKAGSINQLAGVFIHASVASQLISAAIEGQSSLQGFPWPVIGLWTLTWAVLGVVVISPLLNQSGKWLYVKVIMGFLLLEVTLIGMSYSFFLSYWWVPVMAPSLALITATAACIGIYVQGLQQLAYTDGLTKLYNRLYLELQLAKATTVKGTLSVILCDIDHFKLYNDTCGHQAGDRCLQDIASIIRQAARQVDVVARYGGEEIAVLLLQTDKNTAIQVADRILNQIRKAQLPHPASQVEPFVTLSCGLATLIVDTSDGLDPGLWTTELIRQADHALYEAKAAGRNCLRVATTNE